MYTHILIPAALDEEGWEDRALLQVARKLRPPDGRNTLLHVAEVLPSYLDMNVLEDIVGRNRVAAEERLKETAKREGAEGRTVSGHAGRDIVDFADRHAVAAS